MALKLELMNAILAMDAYNRGYDASIELPSAIDGSVSIAKATIIDAKGDAAAQAIGFYALAYDTDGDGAADIIAYRGTDYPAEGQTTLGIPNDIYHGWTLGGGDLASEQGIMAIDFYKEVAGAGNPYINNTLILTGHSLGGGLSGFVGAIYNKEAYVYDAMAYELSAKRATNYIVDYSEADGTLHSDEIISVNAFVDFQTFYPGATLIDWEFQNPDYINRINGGNHPAALDFDRINGYYVEGEVLSYAQMARADDADYSNSNSKIDILNGIDLIPGINPIDEAIARHSQATLVITMFKDEVPSLTDWQAAAQYFWPVLYDGDFAKSIGMDNPTLAGELQASASSDNTTGHYADILRMIIAYSAIDEGTRVFGDTGIRTLYDDANDLGRSLVAAGADSAIETYAVDISKAFVQFAGQLALAKVEQTDFTLSAANRGVISADGEFYHDYSNDNHSLMISFSDLLWSQAEKGGVDIVNMTARDDLVNKILAATGDETQILSHMINLWGDGTANAFDGVVFATDNLLPVNMSNNLTSKSSIFVGDSDAETVYGSSGGDLILSYGGNDVVYSTGGNDLIYFGSGPYHYVAHQYNDMADVIYGGSDKDIADYSARTGSITVVPDGEIYRVYFDGYDAGNLEIYEYDTLVDVEVIIGTDQRDYFEFGETDITFVGGGLSGMVVANDNVQLWSIAA